MDQWACFKHTWVSQYLSTGTSPKLTVLFGGFSVAFVVALVCGLCVVCLSPLFCFHFTVGIMAPLVVGFLCSVVVLFVFWVSVPLLCLHFTVGIMAPLVVGFLCSVFVLCVFLVFVPILCLHFTGGSVGLF